MAPMNSLMKGPQRQQGKGSTNLTQSRGSSPPCVFLTHPIFQISFPHSSGSVCSRCDFDGKVPNKEAPSYHQMWWNFLPCHKGFDPKTSCWPWSPLLHLASLISLDGARGVTGPEPKCTDLHLKSHSGITNKRQPGIILRASLSSCNSQRKKNHI